ncbi:chemotaxis protein [Mycobacterium sp.]|uniref:chemotaxis protein n=1 Tax=Mycobacterium sp. TaxID=1785 RepID=UPI0028BD5656|nr:chemotaxis protein [Mycobacterium sp.]
MRSADSLLDENSGETIEAMHGKFMGDRLAVVDQSDLYQTMSEVVDQVAQLIYHARARLDDIDREANEEIERIKQAAANHPGSLAAATQAIAAVIAKAKAAAAAECAQCASEIFSQGARIGVKPPAAPAADPLDDLKGLKGPGGGSIRDGMPTGLIGGLKQDTPTQDNAAGSDAGSNQPKQGSGGSAAGGGEPKPGEAGKPADPTADGGAAADAAKHAAGGASDAAGGAAGANQPGDVAPQPLPPVATPVNATGAARGVAGLGGGSSSGMGGGMGGMGSGFSGGGSSMPSGGASSVGSLGSSMGTPASGLTTPASGGIPGAPPPANDFARGFGSGFNAAGGSAGSMLPPPTSAAPPPASGAPTGSMAAGPAPISSTAGPAPSSAPVAAASAAGPMSPMMMPPPAGGGAAGPLPPFGSDVARQAAVTPASGGPTASSAPAASPPATASAPLAPLPPGVVASGVGASALGAGIGVRSTAPDPLLESASALVYQLMHGSRLYAAIDWCVGAFKTPSGVETVVVSNEGCGFIPVGVFIPRSVRMLFSDPNVGNGFRARWFSWVNPAQTMLAYAASISEGNPNIELWALAVSTDHGGSAVPARDAGIRHFEDCSLMVSPIQVDAPAAALDQSHQHRLETVDHAEYSRLTAASGQRGMDRFEMWAKTLGPVRTALSRASNLLGFSVPPVIRHVTSALGNGEPVTDQQWNDLELARLNATLDSASQRPGRMLDSEGVTPHGRAYHNLARTAELLGMWHGAQPPAAEIAYTARQITGEAALWPTGNE